MKRYTRFSLKSKRCIPFSLARCGTRRWCLRSRRENLCTIRLGSSGSNTAPVRHVEEKHRSFIKGWRNLGLILVQFSLGSVDSVNCKTGFDNTHYLEVKLWFWHLHRTLTKSYSWWNSFGLGVFSMKGKTNNSETRNSIVCVHYENAGKKM